MADLIKIAEAAFATGKQHPAFKAGDTITYTLTNTSATACDVRVRLTDASAGTQDVFVTVPAKVDTVNGTIDVSFRQPSDSTSSVAIAAKVAAAGIGATTFNGTASAKIDVASVAYKGDTVTFTPSAGATMSKVASAFTPGENGGGTITYTIWVKTNADNSYVLDNVKIMDALDGSIENQNRTSAPIRQYLSYDANSFHLYQGGSNGQNV